jgi:molybdate transport system ATP-binding protein
VSQSLDVHVRHTLGRLQLHVHLAMGAETLALIGPSGAGKSSVLRFLAGLATPDHGRIICNGRVLLDTQARVDLPPEEREIGVVFQDGALFPHLTVAQNIEYGLRPKARDRRERRERAAGILERFGIAHLATAKPDRVSGGERQRVALARAVATSPALLLLDEPLSALDAVTKAAVAEELAATLAELRLPAILVSHDLEDVAGLADRVAVMDDGVIVQTGTTAELLQAPRTGFVAAFVGANYFSGAAHREREMTLVELDGGGVVTSTQDGSGRVGVVVQPWHVRLAPPTEPESDMNGLTGTVFSIAPHGSRLRIAIASSPRIIADVSAQGAWVSRLKPGDVVTARWPQALTPLVPEQDARPED